MALSYSCGPIFSVTVFRTHVSFWPRDVWPALVGKSIAGQVCLELEWDFGREGLANPLGNISKALSLISFIVYFDPSDSYTCLLISL